MRLPQAFLLIIALWATLFLPGLGDTELKGEEGRRILPAREMLRRDNFVQPYSEGRPYHRKPPGINWAIAGVFKLTGVQNDWTARVPSVLAALALALTGVWAGRRLGGGAVGLALGIALLVNGGMLEKARLAEIEALYVSLAGMGMLSWAALWGTGRSPWLVWLSTVLPFALANLVKGPVYLLFLYPVVLMAHRRTRTWREFFHPAHLISLALALTPMIIWGVLVKQQLADSPPLPILDEEGNELLVRTPGEVWWQQISGRLRFVNINVKDWLLLPWKVLLILAPWPLLAWLMRWKNPAPETTPETRRAALQWALGWGLVWSIVGFCLLPATRARYLMPALGPVALWAVLVLFAAPARARRLWWWEAFQVWHLGIASVAAVVVPWFLLASPWWAVGLNTACVALCWFCWVRLRGPSLVGTDEEKLRAFTLTALPFVVLSIFMATTVLPRARLQENVRPTAEALNALATEPGSIVAINPGPDPFLFYLGPRCAEVIKLSEFPADAAYLLVQQKLWTGESQTRAKLQSRGFTKIISSFQYPRFEDGKGRSYLLIGLDPSTTETQKNSEH